MTDRRHQAEGLKERGVGVSPLPALPARCRNGCASLLRAAAQWVPATPPHQDSLASQQSASPSLTHFHGPVSIVDIPFLGYSVGVHQMFLGWALIVTYLNIFRVKLETKVTPAISSGLCPFTLCPNPEVPDHQDLLHLDLLRMRISTESETGWDPAPCPAVMLTCRGRF